MERDGQFSALVKPKAVKIEDPVRNTPTQPGLGALFSNTLLQTPMQHQAPEQAPHKHDHAHAHGRLLAAVKAWLHEEKAKRQNRATSPSRDKSYTELGLEKLEQILAEHHIIGRSHRAFEVPHFPRRRHSSRKLKRPQLVGHPSDTEYQDGEPVVPSTDVSLDNTKVCGYTDAKEEEAWHSFKLEIVRLTHTLRLRGWRRVPLERGGEIGIERLCGALTNAVYVVTPPADLPQTPAADNAESYVPKRQPLKLLLRVYGPQTGNLIDREKELQILERLARKKIGPRLLGTFLNGRFEQYLNANPLGPQDFRDPVTYKQIAKRMRELHDGVDLLREERDAGPFVWQNWDKWVKRCEEVVCWLDEQILAYRGSIDSKADVWKTRGLVCGVPWASFRSAVDNYRKWLNERHGGKEALREQLVFAHNDTQYGNILRIEPAGDSPLIHPANEHRQLVVIDFEYANANTRGLEFANYFTEWCYDYHSTSASWACNVAAYPHPEDQRRFIRAYVEHRPYYAAATENDATPSGSGENRSFKFSLGAFKLDARVPPNSSYRDEEKAREENMKAEIEQLMHDSRLWRVANSAGWVAWGIVQAKVAGMEEALKELRVAKAEISAVSKNGDNIESEDKNETGLRAEMVNTIDDEEKALEKEEEETPRVPHEQGMDDEEDFDYLAYAQDRAMFLWGDLLELGLVKEEELPELVLKHAKRIQY